MITENLSTLKIHKLTQEQYDREIENGTLDESAIYLTPEKETDLSGYATVEQLNSHGHPTATKSSDGFMSQVDANKVSVLFPNCTTSGQVSPSKFSSWTLPTKGWWSIDANYYNEAIGDCRYPFGLFYWGGSYLTEVYCADGLYKLSINVDGSMSLFVRNTSTKIYEEVYNDGAALSLSLYGICLIEDVSSNT